MHRYNFKVNVQSINAVLDITESCVVQFGDDWPGVFFESSHANKLAEKLDVAYESNDMHSMVIIVKEIYDLLCKSNLHTNPEMNDVIMINHQELRLESGHVAFSNKVKGYFLRGDNAYMMKLGIENFVADGEAYQSNSHIPFLINECRHWAR